MSKHVMFRYATLFGLCLGCTIPGLEREEAAESASPSVPAPVSADGATEMRHQKLAAYATECMNRFHPQVRASLRRYFAWADRDTGPQPDQPNVDGLFSMGDVSPSLCRAAVTRVAAMEPSMPPIEAAAARYATALEELQPLLARASTYYDRGAYRADNMAVGREMHPELVRAFDEYIDAAHDLEARVGAAQTAMLEQRIGRLRVDPAQRSVYLVERTMLTARLFVAQSERSELRGDHFEHPESGALAAARDALRIAVDELLAGEVTSRDRPPRGMPLVRVRAGALRDASSMFTARIGSDQVFDANELRLCRAGHPEMVEGTTQQVMGHYNALIDAYNLAGQ